MRSETTEVGTQGRRGRSRLAGRRPVAARKAKLRQLALEGLEERTLMAVLPTPTVTNQIDISNSRGDESSPSIAVDPQNPQNLVAVWTRIDQRVQNPPLITIEGATSRDGGSTWQQFSPLNGLLADPTTMNPVLPFPQVTDPSVAFDRNGNFYVSSLQHRGDLAAGAVVLSKFNFGSSSPTAIFTEHVVYEWTGSTSEVVSPTLAVDNNVPSFTDTDSKGQTRVQTDPFAGNVYVAWATVDLPQAGNPLGNNFNPNRAIVVASSDGGQSFTGQLTANDGANVGSSREATPKLAISQGRAPRPAGTLGPNDPGDPGVVGGQVTVIWDDFGIGAQASPAFDALFASRITDGAVGAVFTGGGGFIQDAVDPGNSQPHIAGVTDFPLNVNITNPLFTTLTDLDVEINLIHPNLDQLQIVLIPPTSSGLKPITLVRNQTDTSNNMITGIGISGADMGTTPSGVFLGTIFDQSATRNIVDINPANGNRGAAAPFTGHFRPEAGSLSQYNGTMASLLNGDWTLEITDTRSAGATPPTQFLVNWSLHFTSGFTDTADNLITTTLVRGAIGDTYSLTSPVTPKGIGPGISLATDNTLGAFSPFQGRLYMAFVDRDNTTGNPSDNTDIFLTHSDDGGLTWSAATRVNDDLAATDGFSEASYNILGQALSGRPQFQPSVVVDNSTGTVVMSWFDARNDAAKARVATYIGASIDGGETFAPETFANTPKTATDAITGNTIVIGPVPDNQSPGNPFTEATFSYGPHQGLAVLDGRIHPIWSSNLNSAGVNNDSANGNALLDIRTATATIGTGPRVVDSTMGPVGQTDQLGNPIDTVNPNRTADGTPIVSAFEITFDRPVDPSTFTSADVQVFFRDTTASNASGGSVPVLGVVPIPTDPNDPSFPDAGYNPNNIFGFTKFRVNFAARSAVGTYSYAVGPNISDRIRALTISTTPSGARQVFNSTDTPKPLPDVTTTSSVISISGVPANLVVSDLRVNLSLNHTFDSDLVISLISPGGTQVILSNREGGSGDNFTNTTFDDAASRPISSGFAPFTGSFRPEAPLKLFQGQAINGAWTLIVSDQAFLDSGTLLNWSLDIQPGLIVPQNTSGNKMDQDADGNNGVLPPLAPAIASSDVYAAPRPLNGVQRRADGSYIIAGPFDHETLPLIVPGPHIISSNVPGTPVSGDNLALDRTVSALDVTFDREMVATSFTAADVLQVLAPNRPLTGPFDVYAAYNSTDVNRVINDGGTITSTLTIPNDGGVFTISDLNVRLNLTHPQDSDLSATLIAPNGTRIQLFSNVGGGGKNFSDTVFDDQATTPIAQGVPPYGASFKPVGSLAALNGMPLQGTWKLEISDSKSNGKIGTLDSWSLEAKTANPNATARTFRVTFPTQQLSGTYTVSLQPNILSRNGDELDSNQNAGVDLLTQAGLGSTNPTIPITYNSTNVPVTIDDLKTTTSTITISDSYLLAGVTLTLNITHPHDPDLVADLIAPDGTVVRLFTNIGSTGTQQNFSNTTFDDNATTPIQNGGPPYFGTFNPQQPLSALNGLNVNGIWTLRIQDTGAGNTGTLNSWSLKFLKPVPSSGLGEPAADRASTSFRIFTMDPTNPLSSSTWTAVGPAGINDGENSGRIGGIAVDPSDPSGNTVYVAGASGGVWKTTNFLTTQGNGPTWVPLTDFGPTTGINIGSITVFGRNNDPSQSIVIASTGEGDSSAGAFAATQGTTAAGVGFLISKDGGATWTLLDSTTNVDSQGNPLSFNDSRRDHAFVGTTSYKVLVDPRPTPTGEVIIYAALGGDNANLAGSQGGVWRSLDTGKHWQQMRAGQATDIVLDLNSGTGTSDGNLQIIYAGFRGEGVFASPNRGQTWNQLLGGIGDPLIQDAEVAPSQPIPVTAPSDTPTGNKGRIVLAKPGLTFPNNPVENVQYQGWLYAVVVGTNDHVNGLYLTKDFGQNWTKVRIPTLPPGNNNVPRAVPSNDSTLGDYDVAGGGLFAQGNYDISLAVDANDPAIVYLGGTADGQPSGLLRVDTTTLADPHALVAYDNNAKDTGLLQRSTTGPITLKRPTGANSTPPSAFYNLIRDPNNPFLANSTILLGDPFGSFPIGNTMRFNNQGTGATWTPLDFTGIIENSTDQHRVVSMVDPLTGQTRLIFGDDQGIWTGVVKPDGTLSTGIGTANLPTGRRSGNLQITQFYYGASQPSGAAAQVAQALFYGQAQDDGFPVSDADVLQSGQIGWNGPEGDGTGVATDQTGTGVAYRYNWPCCGGGGTDFFQVDLPPDGGGIGRTFGLLQASQPGPVPDPQQWPFLGGFNFAVNPINGNQILISSGTGQVYRTENQGVFWSVIGDASVFNNSHSDALAFGAPDPNGPGGIGNFDNFLYVGTNAGHIFVTQTGGGGGAGNAWVDITNGDLANDGSPVHAIITNPTRGSHEAYAVTDRGVYHIVNSVTNPGQAPTTTWVNITGNLFQITHQIFGDPNLVDTQLRALSSIVADWRYVIPDDFSNPNSPTHPMLYVAGEGGVYRSTDQGKTWSLFPDQTLNNTPMPPGVGGGLPNAHVTDLDIAQGAINPVNGQPVNSSDKPNILLATTYGRGSFAIRLAPLVFSNSLHFSTTLPAPSGSDSGASNTDRVTNVVQPVIDGLSEQTAFGNVVTVQLIDLTDPTNPQIIGTGQTDTAGRFSIQVMPGYFKSDGSTDGVKTIGVQAVDQAGTAGNIATFQFTLDTVAPAAPDLPDLIDTSDSGLSNTDNITNASGVPPHPAPVFFVGSTEPDTTVITLIRDGGTVVGQRNGAGQITDPGPISDGTHTYSAQQVDLAGNISAVSAILMVTVDTVAPNRPDMPTLKSEDDSGTKGDNITNVTKPRLTGQAEPNGQVQLIDAANNVIGTAQIASNGTYTVQPTNNLIDGDYFFRVRVEDVAGNISQSSNALHLTILTRQPNIPTLALSSTSDSGILGDNITSDTTPTLIGFLLNGAGLSVDLVDNSTGNKVTTAIVQPDNTFQLTFPLDMDNHGLPDGPITVHARARDTAGNTRDSAPLTITIDTSPPSVAPTLMLVPADDSGVQGDNITVVRRPHLTGMAEPGAFVDIISIDAGGKSTTQASGTAGPDGIYTLQLPNDLSNGTIKLQARIRDAAGNQGTPSGELNLTITSIVGDYNGDGQADIATYRRPVAFWSLLQSNASPLGVTLQVPGLDVPVQGDFDGDGKTDVAIYRPSNSTWVIQRSTLGPITIAFGAPNLDIPVPADYDGDGKADIATYRPTTGQWSLLLSGSGPKAASLLGFSARPGDVPVPADFDGDGKADLAVYRPSNSTWTMMGSSSGNNSLTSIPFGAPNLDIPVPADYDGDGKADIATYRPTTALWSILGSTSGPHPFLFGGPNLDIPVPADYDGDGRVDVATYRPGNSTWYLSRSHQGNLAVAFGAPNMDIPVPAPYRYRALPGTVFASGSSSGRSFGLNSVPSGNAGTGSLNFGQQAASLLASSSSTGSSSASAGSTNAASNPATPSSGNSGAGGLTRVVNHHGDRARHFNVGAAHRLLFQRAAQVRAHNQGLLGYLRQRFHSRLV